MNSFELYMSTITVQYSNGYFILVMFLYFLFLWYAIAKLITNTRLATIIPATKIYTYHLKRSSYISGIKIAAMNTKNVNTIPPFILFIILF